MAKAMVSVRPYSTSDLEAVVDLWGRCGLIVAWNDPRRDIARKLEVDAGPFLVGEREGKVVATVMAGYDGHRGWINYLAVLPDLQRHGIGRLMMERAEAVLRRRGCAKINLQVRAGNTAVLAFYRSLGFAEDKVVSLGKRLIED